MMTGQPAYGFWQSMVLEMPADLAGVECGAKKQCICFAGKMRDAERPIHRARQDSMPKKHMHA